MSIQLASDWRVRTEPAFLRFRSSHPGHLRGRRGAINAVRRSSCPAIPCPENARQLTRRELGLRLRQIRKTAGLTGQMLADATGQHFTRISRIENGIQPPTDRNIRDWCTACGAGIRSPI